MIDWRELLLDLVLPETDRGVAIQWAIMVPVWSLSVLGSMRLERDLRHFVQGLCMITFAWFMARMIH